MDDFMTSCKSIFIRTAKMIGRNTRRFIKAVKYKVHELADLRKRRKLVRDLGELIYTFSSEGLILPVEAAELVKKITLLDSDLNNLRNERAAQKTADAQLRAAEKAAHAAEKAAAKAAAVEQNAAAMQVDISEGSLTVAESMDNVPETPVLDIQTGVEEASDTEIPTLKP